MSGSRVAQYRVHPGGGRAVDRVVVIDGGLAAPDFLMFEDDLGVVWTRVDRFAAAAPEFVATPLGFGPLFDQFVQAAVDRALSGDGGQRLQVSGWDPKMVDSLIRSYLHDEVLKGLLVGRPLVVSV